MPSLTSLLRRVTRLVVGQVNRQHATLECLAREVCAANARAIGQATGETVGEALRVILDGPPNRPNNDRLEDRERSWGQHRRPTWPAARRYDPSPRDPHEPGSDDHLDEDRRYGYEAAEENDPLSEEPLADQQSKWSRAVAVGWQAASWWLRWHAGRLSLIATAGIGIAAGVATLVSSPLVAGTSGCQLLCADELWHNLVDNFESQSRSRGATTGARAGREPFPPGRVLNRWKRHKSW